jgi:hypothetical protein
LDQQINEPSRVHHYLISSSSKLQFFLITSPNGGPQLGFREEHNKRGEPERARGEETRERKYQATINSAREREK